MCLWLRQVGGSFSTTVFLHHMKKFGQAVLVGHISTYNEKEPPKGNAIGYISSDSSPKQ